MRKIRTTGVVDVRVESVSRGVVGLSFSDRTHKKWPETLHMYEDDTIRITFHLDTDGDLEDLHWAKGRFISND